MAIVIVDDTMFSLEVTKAWLKAAGYMDIITVKSARELYRLIDGHSEWGIVEVDLILMDIVMPEINGIEACQSVKKREWLVDVPVIMVTSRTDRNDLHLAFSSGAMDYIKKPLDSVELLARVRSALKLKHETARRKARELELLEVTRQLQAANERLQNLSFFDGLTGIANRRNFDQRLLQERKRAMREKNPLSLIMLDIDYFKAFNDTYGHLKGDDCLITVASLLVKTLRRPGDFPARYGGEEFGVVLPNTDDIGAAVIAEELRASIERANIEHISSPCADHVTISLGVVTRFQGHLDNSNDLIMTADRALYCSKNQGRNRVTIDILKND
ncbi:diguanylate cyclase domain-containing protein [Desulfosporosinus meridiei]|uniref:Stage 0 sporulation protein A homolog n=1 Tax=Desulfosporosinus meridiei (strain ATCC BAA-275 / DSM 13257 / KCTC 12902 / NCIMB 13706 / S10) TaxID=768704 RepID=J7IUA7_DESMD|nr:diguanylate cyclase [Desulfosporosinus meridiei]AFQ45437.1 diguanylate cyclase (GGDEF) domain-containing protein [Desulfosporosinus meridiei DSM 13257]